MVTSLKVTFSEPVTFPSGMAAAFQLQRTGPGAPNQLVNLNVAPSGNNVITITFNDPAYAPGAAKSLIDGTYQLTLVADKIQSASGFLDGDLNGTAGGDLILNLHRLFGDSDGDRTVDGDDFLAIRLAFLQNSIAFDFNDDGVVNGTDFLQFRLRFLQVI
jgi:hypothetical protein